MDQDTLQSLVDMGPQGGGLSPETAQALGWQPNMSIQPPGQLPPAAANGPQLVSPSAGGSGWFDTVSGAEPPNQNSVRSPSVSDPIPMSSGPTNAVPMPTPNYGNPTRDMGDIDSNLPNGGAQEIGYKLPPELEEARANGQGMANAQGTALSPAAAPGTIQMPVQEITEGPPKAPATEVAQPGMTPPSTPVPIRDAATEKTALPAERTIADIHADIDKNQNEAKEEIDKVYNGPGGLIKEPKTQNDLLHNQDVFAKAETLGEMYQHRSQALIGESTYHDYKKQKDDLVAWEQQQQVAQHAAMEDAKREHARYVQLGSDLANRKVDPTSFYRPTHTDNPTLNTLGNIAYTIGLALSNAAGAFGGAITHSPNYAGEIISNAINQHVAEQQRQISESSNQLAKAHEISMKMFDQQMNATELERASRTTLLASAYKDVENIAQISKNSDPVAAENLKAQLQARLNTQLLQTQAEKQKLAQQAAAPGAASDAGRLKYEDNRSAWVKDMITGTKDTDNTKSSQAWAAEYDKQHPLEAKKYGSAQGLSTDVSKKVSEKSDVEKARDESIAEGKREWLSAYSTYMNAPATDVVTRTNALNAMKEAHIKVSGATREVGKIPEGIDAQYPGIVGRAIGTDIAQLNQIKKQLGIEEPKAAPKAAAPKKEAPTTILMEGPKGLFDVPQDKVELYKNNGYKETK